MEVWLMGYVLLVSLTLFLMMKIDKVKAQKNQYRISERTLWTLAIIGGALGGTAGMRLFRHKTKHVSFTIGFPVLALIDFILLVELLVK